MKTNMKKRVPTVSVIMPVHNPGEFVVSAIQSILNQSFTDFELLVVNDGSTDDSLSILKKFAREDKRVNVISYTKNKGESAAANVGFRQAKGKYIARMDADDIAHPDRLAKQVEFLDTHPEYIVVGTQAHVIDELDQVMGKKTFPTSHTAIYREYGNLHPMLHPSIMVRRSLIPWKDKLWANEAEPNDDYYTLFHFLQVGKFANLPQKLMYYRMHSNNKSMQHIKKKFLNSLRIRLYAVRKLGYPLNTKMVITALTQSAVVLAVPQWVTVGLFFWMRGMKPFEKAFPQFGPLIANIKSMLNGNIRPEYILPVLIASVIEVFFFNKNS